MNYLKQWHQGMAALLMVMLGLSNSTALASTSFPVKYSADSRYLTDQNGVPFPILGRTAWFITSVNQSDHRAFIDDTASRGYTAIEFHVLNHDPRGHNPPFSGNFDLPFQKRLDGNTWTGALTYGTITNEAPDFTTPNEAYWTLVDSLLTYCESKGILVFMFPAYVGYNGQEQGWMQEMVANGSTKMQTYGAWLATRYKNQKNLVWMMGGDMGTGSHPFNTAQTAAENGLLTGLKSVAGQQSIYFSAEWDSESIGTDQPTFGSAMTLNSVYSWTGDVNNHGRRAYAHTPVEPAFLLEEPYDQEGPAPDGNGYNPSSTQPVRRFQWWGVLSTIGGYISGNGYVWPFRTDNTTVDWRNHLDTQGSRDMARLNAFIKSIAWQSLVPSGLNGMKTLITAGGSTVSSADYVAAAAKKDGNLLVAYIPPAHSGSITVDMSAMSGSSRARWFDPTSAAYSNAGTNLVNTGTLSFTPPGLNSVGANDWVLVIDRGADTTKPALRVSSPTTASNLTNTTGTLNLAGTASDNVAVKDVAWSNDRGGQGVAAGTNSWSIQGIALAPGLNLITLTAQDVSGNTTQAVLNATYLVPPFFLEQPTSRFAATNDSVTFDTEVDGDEPFKFQWRKNGINITGATNKSLTLTNITTAASAAYTVRVSNLAGAITSSNAILKVFVPPKFTSQPANRSVTLSNRVVFGASASGTTPLLFQWWLGGEAVPGATNSSYAINQAQTNQAGLYSVTVSNYAGVRLSTNAQLTVNVPPSFQVQPRTQFVITGPTNLSFFAAATGTEPIRYQWRKNGGNITGATNPVYVLTNITSSSGGTFTVLIANVAGSKVSSNALLKVFTAPAFTSQPANRSVTEGGATTFSAGASGTTPLFYQWWLEGDSIPGATNSTYRIPVAQTNQSGSYSITVSNFAGARASSNAVLTVNVPPHLTVQPQSQTVVAGGVVAFNSAAYGTAPLKFQWRKNGGNITGATNSSLVIYNATNSNAGSYSVFVQNPFGSVTSTNAVLTVQPQTAARPVVPAMTEAPPTLSFAIEGEQLSLWWPASAVDFSLQSSTDLLHWQTLPTPDIVDGNCIAKDKFSGPARFYRLIK
ncbi:MAG: hypothetical protein RLY20_1701 [Verrucomicrobiota bacterium]|jgi:hypothetical protein